jgi:hypothetical protein
MTEKILADWIDWFERTYPERRLPNLQNPYDAEAPRQIDDRALASKDPQLAIRALNDEVRGLRETVGALIDVLTATSIVDGVKVKERFAARAQDLVVQVPLQPLAAGVKIVHTIECHRCGATNRGDADTCVKCERTLR